MSTAAALAAFAFGALGGVAGAIIGNRIGAWTLDRTLERAPQDPEGSR